MNMKIYRVTTCKFTDIKKIDCIGRLAVDKYTERFCILDSDNSIAFDIFTNQQFPMILKTEDNKIICFDKINLWQEYATYVQSLDLNELSKKQLLKLKYAYFRFKIFNSFSEKQKQSKQNIIKR